MEGLATKQWPRTADALLRTAPLLRWQGGAVRAAPRRVSSRSAMSPLKQPGCTGSMFLGNREDLKLEAD